jgi:uncharacterized membrane protein
MLNVMLSASLIAATVAVGLMAGVFALYSNAIMPGLGRTDDRTFVGAFQAIDSAIINPAFLSTFVGALLFTGAAAALLFLRGGSLVLPWVLAAFVQYLAVFVITMAINVPLNDGIKAAGDPGQIANLAQVRRRFDEAKWIRWNHVRALATIGAFACLIAALLQHGRAF